MVRSFLLLAAVSVTSLLLHAAAQPETFFVQRTASIDAPPEAIHSMIDDLRRFNAWNPYGKKDPNNTFEFTLVPRGGSTDVTWAMYGPSPFVARLIGLFVDMDATIGRDFEAGLADLKRRAERSYASGDTSAGRV